MRKDAFPCLPFASPRRNGAPGSPPTGRSSFLDPFLCRAADRIPAFPAQREDSNVPAAQARPFQVRNNVTRKFRDWNDRTFSFFGFPHAAQRSEEHTSELQSLMRNSYAVFFF